MHFIFFQKLILRNFSIAHMVKHLGST